MDNILLGIGEVDRCPALQAPSAGDGGADAGLGLQEQFLLAGRELDDGAAGFRQGHENAVADAKVALAEMGAFDGSRQAQSPLFQVLGSHEEKCNTHPGQRKFKKIILIGK
jgi:hypothetical protein